MSDVATQAPKNAAQILKDQLTSHASYFQASLPVHVPIDKFMRVVLTAIAQNPKLVTVERRSLFTACSNAAKDGLLPDGRQAALVIFDDKKRGQIAQYLPMIAGIRQLARNTGEITLWETHLVYQHDEFVYELGDEPLLRHRPHLGADRGEPVAVYSVVILKGGERSREVMTVAEINEIRERSTAWRLFKAKKIFSTPWDSDWGEMARKTVARRHRKSLPLSSDIEAMFQREDDIYGKAPVKDQGLPSPNSESRPRLSITERLDSIVAKDPDYAEPKGLGTDFDEDTGEVFEEVTEAKASDDPDFAEVEGAPDPRLEEALDHARRVAKQGGKPFTKWVASISAPDFERLAPIMSQLKELARKADAKEC